MKGLISHPNTLGNIGIHQSSASFSSLFSPRTSKFQEDRRKLPGPEWRSAGLQRNPFGCVGCCSSGYLKNRDDLRPRHSRGIISGLSGFGFGHVRAKFERFDLNQCRMYFEASLPESRVANLALKDISIRGVLLAFELPLPFHIISVVLQHMG